MDIHTAKYDRRTVFMFTFSIFSTDEVVKN